MLRPFPVWFLAIETAIMESYLKVHQNALKKTAAYTMQNKQIFLNQVRYICVFRLKVPKLCIFKVAEITMHWSVFVY